MKEITEVVKDILLDLDDEGFDTSVNVYGFAVGGGGPTEIDICVSFYKSFYFNEIEEVLDRVQEYLIQYGYKLDGQEFDDREDEDLQGRMKIFGVNRSFIKVTYY